TTSGAHLTVVDPGQLFGIVDAFGTTISAGMTSIGGLAPGASSVGSNAPVAALRRFGVGRFASRTSSMFVKPCTTDASTPYFVSASTGAAEMKFTPAFRAGSYGAAAS